jgi:hypothetical protein
MVDLNTVKISEFSWTKDTIPVPLTINEELESIRNGKVKNIILKCRSLFRDGKKDEYRATKESQLPAVTFSGEVDRSRSDKNVAVHSKFVCIDFDGLPEEAIESIKYELFNDKHVCAAWLSPSGFGIKLIFYCDATIETHLIYYKSILKYLDEQYFVKGDEKCKNLSHLCYTSYDSDLLRKDNAEMFAIDISELSSSVEQNNVAKTIKPFSYQADATKMLFKTEGRNNAQIRLQMKRILKYLKKNNLSITYKYEDWYQVAYAIASAFTYDVGQKYFHELSKLDKFKYTESAAENILRYSYLSLKEGGITFGKIIYLAKKQGFMLRKFNKL